MKKKLKKTVILLNRFHHLAVQNAMITIMVIKDNYL